MKKIDWFLILLISFFILAGLIFIFRPGGEEKLTMINNILTIAFPLFTVIVSFLLVRKLGTSGLQARAVLFLFLGFLSWLIADILWMIFNSAVVSPADIFYLLGYALVFVGIIYGVRLSSPDLFKNKLRGIIFLFIMALLIVGYFYFFPLSWDSEISVLENILTSGYIIADLLLIIPLILLCYSLFEGRLSRGWILIFLGTVISLAGDLWYAKNYALYEAGTNAIDLVWYAGYLVWIYAMVEFRRAHEEMKEHLKTIVQKKT